MNWTRFGWYGLAFVLLVGCGGEDASSPDAADGRGGETRTTDAQSSLDLDAAGLPDLVPVDELVADGLPGDLGPCPGGCDDGNDCTVDLCTELGCEHEEIPDCCPNATLYTQSFNEEEAPAELSTSIVVPTYPDQPELTPPGWQVAQLEAHSPPGALYFGDPEDVGYDNGHRVAADALLSGIELPSDDLLTLSLWLYLDVEEGPYSDYVTIAVEVDGERVRIWSKDDETPVKSWFELTLDLTPFGGQTVALVVSFDSHDEHENSGKGVFVDDVTVLKTCSGPAVCEGDVHCDLGYPCLEGSCADGFCLWEWDPECCLTPGDCEDWDGCTIEKCSDNVCAWQDDPDPLCCTTNDVCDDEDDECTTDVCLNSYCAFLPSGGAGCCQADDDCDDQDDCTLDRCKEMSCSHINLCCATDADCDDGDDVCTIDTCQTGACVFAPSGADGCCVPNLVSEGFEAGWADFWSYESTNENLLHWEISGLNAYEGDMALTCSSDEVEDSVVARALLPVTTMPPPGATLTFRLAMSVEDPGDCDANAFSVTFNDVALGTWCNSLASWQKLEVSLDEVAGQTGELAFEFAADPWAIWEPATYELAVDNVSLDQTCCNADNDCDDGKVCTTDVCPGLNSFCEFESIDECCLVNADCDNGDECTVGKCTPGHTCVQTDICCDADGDCDDGDPDCTTDVCVEGFCEFQPTGAAGCCLPDVFADSFESGSAAGWELDNDDSGFGWYVTDKNANGGNFSLYYGNAGGTGYGSSNEGRAVSPPIAVPAGAEATLSGMLWYDTEECCDKLAVAILDHEGVRHSLGEVGGTSGGWEAYSADISEFVNQTVRIELAFEADGSLDGIGVLVDDIELTIGCCSDDADCDDGNPCTEDSCPAADSLCAFVPIANCCAVSSDCDDGDLCTSDKCTDGQCQHLDICCDNDGECDDDDDLCTVDLCVDGGCVYEFSGAAGCCQGDLFGDSFENGLDGYVVAGDSDEIKWHLTSEDSFSGTFSLAFTDADADTYGANAYGTITTPLVTLPALDASPELVFMARFKTEACCDLWRVYVVEGDEWTMLGEFGGEEGWQPFAFSLSDFLGKTVQFGFEFDSDGTLSYEGVFIDDLYVEQHCCSLDADCDDDDPCTLDSCPGEDSICVHIPVENCCVTHDACDDGDDCTNDLCDDNECIHYNKCCETDGDCDDFEDVCSADTCINGTCKYEPQYVPGCCFPHLYLEDFDAPLSEKWEINNTDEEYGWHLSQSKSVTGTMSLYYGNVEGNSYGTSNDGEVISPPIDIPAATSAMLAWQLWLDTEENYDELKLSILWNELEVPVETMSGSDIENWQLKEVDLSDFIGQQIRIRFYFDSDSSKTFEGIWIDQLRIEIGCCDSDEECLSGSACIATTCAGPGGMCLSEPLVDCCASAADCDDEDPCTLNSCVAGACQSLPICCEADGDCDDGDDDCTGDICVDGICLYEPLAIAGCCQTELFADSFESGQLSNWTVVNDQEDFGWQPTVLDASSGLYSLLFSNPFGDSYGNNSSGTIQSPDILIPAGSVTPMLRFAAHYETEGCCDLWSAFLVVAGQGEIELGTWGGEAFDWEEYEFDLTSYQGKTVAVKFAFDSDGSSTDPGVFIDDVRFEQGCCSLDADCNDANPCTVDTCPGPNSQCVLEPVPGCCLSVNDCDDSDPCTLDACTAQSTCSHTDICCQQDGDCDDGDDLCTSDTCVDGFCAFTPTGAPGCCQVPLFRDDFAQDKGWEYGNEWERGQATASDCALDGNEDPATDVTGSNDNYLAGVVIGGCTPETLKDYTWLTSPVIAAGNAEALHLAYWRWLNSDFSPYMTNAVEVFDGQQWQTVWESDDTAIEDDEWGFHIHDISNHANAQLRVRFGYKVEDDGVWAMSSWNIDDVVVFAEASGLCCLYDSDCAGFGAQCDSGVCN